MIKFTALFILLVLLASCKKKHAPLVSHHVAEPLECVPEVDHDLIIVEDPLWSDRFQFTKPTVNPNNADEFVCFVKDLSVEQKHSIIKYNMATNQKTILLELNTLAEHLKWGKQGKISFRTGSSIHIFTIDEDGSNLTTWGGGLHTEIPTWSSDGNYLLWLGPSSNNTTYYIQRQNIHTLEIDSVMEFNYDILRHHGPNNRFLTTASLNNYTFMGYRTIVYPSTIGEFVSISSSHSTYNLTSTAICWHVDGSCVYAQTSPGLTNFGVYKIDLDGNFTFITEACVYKSFRNLACTADGKYLIGERLDHHRLNGFRFGNSNIVRLEIETGKTEVINLAD